MDFQSHFLGASLIHMGVTLYGQRRMECTLKDDGGPYLGDVSSAESFVFTPGNVYIGNLCAAEHVVIHESDHDRSEGFETDRGELKVTAMLRTSLFAAGYGRIIKNPPTPKLVYEKANAVVAQLLRDRSLVLPSFEACMAAEESIKEARPADE